MYDFVRYSEVRKKARITLQKFWSGENREGVYYFVVKQCYISENISQGKGKYKDDHSLINEPSDTPLPSPLHTLPSLLPYV